MTSINWADDRGGSGKCDAGANWSAQVPLQVGKSAITVTARDAAGNQAAAKLTVLYSLEPTTWPAFDAVTANAIKDLLVSGQLKGSSLRGHDPASLKITSAPGKLAASLNFPWARYGWPGADNGLDLGEIPFPSAVKTAIPAELVAAAATGISDAFERKSSADRSLLAALAYGGLHQARLGLERELASNLPANSDGPVTLDVDKLSGASGYLTRIARIKWMLDTAPEAPPLAAWTQRLQDVLHSNRGRPQITAQIRPTRFIEYFWGPEAVHAIYWVAGSDVTPIVRYARLGSAQQIGSEICAVLAKGASDAKLGDRLLGPMLHDGGANSAGPRFLPSGSLDSFGIAVGMDGPLSLVSLFHLPFTPQQANLTLLDADTAGQASFSGTVDRLDAICRGRLGTALAAQWVLISLGAAPPEANRLPPTVLWEAARRMTGQPAFSTMQPINRFGRAFNGEVLCFSRDFNVVQPSLERNIKAVNELFVRSGGGEVFDAGFLAPRLDYGQPAWFTLIADPVAAP